MNASVRTTFILLTFLFVVLCALLVYKSNNYNRPNRQWKLSQTILYNTKIVPISTYFDPRSQQSHNNATVILLSMERSLKDSILGCDVDGVINMNSLVQELSIMGWVHSVFNLTHTDCIMYCWDMQVNRDSVVKVIWKLDNETQIELAVRREIVVFTHGPEIDKVMVCATGFGIVRNLDEWLTYQQTIGIPFIHLNVVESFMSNLNTSVLLNNLINKGVVEIVVWEEYFNSSQVYYHSQTLKYFDCMFRYHNVYRYMMIVDFDEYFIPAGPIKDINTYATTMFKLKNTTGSIYLPAVVYPCRNNINFLVKNGNITNYYNTNHYNFTYRQGKSIHKVTTLVMVDPHKAHYLLPSYKVHLVCHTPPKCRASYYIAHFSNYKRFTKHCKQSFSKLN